jgi:hypothetical protein
MNNKSNRSKSAKGSKRGSGDLLRAISKHQAQIAKKGGATALDKRSLDKATSMVIAEAKMKARRS